MWAEYGFDGLSYLSYQALFLLLLAVEFGVSREIAQSPHNHACHEDYAAHLLEVLSAFLPGVPADSLGGREAVGWQFHDEGSIVVAHHEFAENPTHEDGH